MGLKRLIIVRPGETDWNLSGQWQGWVAAPLNEHGRQQVQRLANFMRNIGISALYSSDNKRAQQTAEILATQLGFEPIFDDRLRERSIGHWQGLTVPQIHGWYADEYAQLEADPYGYVIPGGESLGQVRDRVRAVFNEIITEMDKKSEDVTVCIVTHTTTTRTALKEIVPDVDLSNTQFTNTSVTSLLRNDDGSWRLIMANDGTHLEGLESRYMPEVRGR